MSVLVTDGDERSTLAVVRALGRAGVSVAVAHSRRDSLAGMSRFCADHIVVPSPKEDPAGFQQALLREARSGRYRILIPMTDITTLLVAEICAQLRPFVAVPMGSPESIRRAQDKAEMLSIARQLGIGCPQTWLPQDAAECESLAPRLPYPIVIKPRVSKWYAGGHWTSGGVQYAENADELIERFSAAHRTIPRPMLQERLRGEGRGAFVLLWDGKLVASFCHRRLREKPPWGGVSVLREAIPHDAQMVERSYALLREIGWQGVAMVEFKVDERDGIPKLMEVNGRFWGSLQLALDAGVNFPELLYRLAVGEGIPPQTAYRVGVRSRWVLGDLDHLLTRLRHPEAFNGGSRWQACREVLLSNGAETYNEVFRIEDPGPGWHEMKAWVRALLHRPEGRTSR